MAGTALNLRDRQTGEPCNAVCLDEPYTLTDADGGGDPVDLLEGAILVLQEERHPDWPGSRVVANVFQPDEGDAFAARYEITRVIR